MLRKILRRITVAVVSAIGLTGLIYLAGIITQFMNNYQLWMSDDGFSGKAVMKPPDQDFFVCISNALTISGLKCMALIIFIGSSIYLYIRFHDRFDGKSYDDRGFKTSNSGTYGTAGWMSEKEMRDELEVSPVEKASGVILGEYRGRAVCMPENTRLNRHIAIFGASGTMKSRSIIRNALFQALKRGESVVITDPKGELYGDTAELYRQNGYDVRVFNLVDPRHSDSWNCMSDLNGNTLMAQVLTNVIIGNTSSGKGDHFWDNGGNPTRHMDWRCTGNYVRAFAKALGVRLRVSYRVGGFFDELYRIGASNPVEWIDPHTEDVKKCRYSTNYLKCMEIKEQASEEMEELLKQYGCRLKFPAKSPDLSRRWCSAYLKIAVADSVMSNLEKTRTDARILIVSGERRGESAGRAKYNEMEIHRSNAVKRNNRLVHQWRCCIDYTEKDVWEIIKRHYINPHPCYRLGWNRCSCAACIFSTPPLMAGYKELYPEEFRLLCEDEERLGFTIDNKKCLEEYIEGAKSCLNTSDKQALHSILTGEYAVSDIYVDDWHYPIGAFHGAEGGSC